MLKLFSDKKLEIYADADNFEETEAWATDGEAIVWCADVVHNKVKDRKKDQSIRDTQVRSDAVSLIIFE